MLACVLIFWLFFVLFRLKEVDDMKILICQSMRKTILFIVIEVFLCTLSMYLISENFETTSNLGSDILKGAIYFVLATILPVWIVGFIHLRSMGQLNNFNRACAISFTFTLVFLALSVIWSNLLIIALLAPIITFNIVVLSPNVRLVD